MKVEDVIRKNMPDILVKVVRANVDDDCDGRVEDYYEGELSDIPEHLRDCDVLGVGWFIGAGCYGIRIPYLRKEATA